METYRAIPAGYMTVGQLAKTMGVTVRTLQYYDRIGLLQPSTASEGGRRLYTQKEAAALDQILTLKSLGFSLEEIKHRLMVLQSPNDVAAVLAGQADAIRKEIASLRVTLSELETLQKEVLQMQKVDFKRYAAIIHNLQMHNDEYRIIKHLDDEMLEYGRTRFDREDAIDVMETNRRLMAEALRLSRAGISPESEEGQAFAAQFWGMVEHFTKGNQEMLPPLIRAARVSESENAEDMDRMESNAFIGRSLDIYLKTIGIDPDALLEVTT